MERRSGTLRALKKKPKDTVIRFARRGRVSVVAYVRFIASAEIDDQPGAMDAFIDRLVKGKKVADVEVLNVTNKELTAASPKLSCTFNVARRDVYRLTHTRARVRSVCEFARAQLERQQVGRVAR